MKHVKFTSLLLVLAMTLSLFVLCVTPAAAADASTAWDGKSTSFAKGTGTEDDPFLISTPQELAYLATVTTSPVEYFYENGVRLNSQFVANGTRYAANGKGVGAGQLKDYTFISVNKVNYVFDYEAGKAYTLTSALSGNKYAYFFAIGGSIYGTFGSGGNKAGTAVYAFNAETLEYTMLDGVVLGKDGSNYYLNGGSYTYDSADASTYDSTTGRTDAYVASYKAEDGSVKTMLISTDVFTKTASKPCNTLSYGGKTYAWLSDGKKLTHPSYTSTVDANGVYTVIFGDPIEMFGAYSSAYYQLVKDLYLNEDYLNSAEWINPKEDLDWTVATDDGFVFNNPKNSVKTIATSDSPFAGVFEGNGHTIYGIYGSGASGNGTLFAAVSGTVKNLHLDHLNVHSSGKGSTGYIGGIAGKLCENGLIDNCHVTNAEVNSATTAGGIAGYNGVKDNSAGNTISNCSFDGAVYNIGTNNTGVAGGIVGNPGSDSAYFTVSNCTVRGLLMGYHGAYGIMNNSQRNPIGKIENCTNYATVISPMSKASGIQGHSVTSSSGTNIQIINCVNYGPISGKTYAAGIFASYDGTSGSVKIIDCANYGTITCQDTPSAGCVGTVANNAGFTITGGTYVGRADHAIIGTVAANAKAGLSLDNVAYLGTPYVNANSFNLDTSKALYAVDLAAASVTLADSLTVNFYGKVSEGTAAPLVYTKAGESFVRVIHPVSANVGGTDYVLYALNDVKASDIATALTLQIGTSGTFTYSIATYASRMYGEDANLDALLVALMQYADAAETAKVGSSSVLDDFVAAKGIEAPDLAAAYAAVNLTPAENVDGTYVESVALDLTDSVRPILKVVDGVAEVTVAIYGETYTYAVVDGEVIIDCLTATSLNNEMVLSFVDAEGNVLGTTGYAVANYIKSVETLDLARALAVYMQAARAYNGLD